jgi:DNA-binding NarL/FixJ family response regulator
MYTCCPKLATHLAVRRKPDPLKKIKILLLEDNRILRDGIKALVNAQPDLKIVAASEGKHETLREVRSLKAHVVLLDLGLQNENGLEVVKTLSREMPETKVIGMGLIPSQLDIIEIVEAGAAGFILKDASIGDFLETIRSVARGHKVLPPLLTGSLFNHVVQLALRQGKRNLSKGVRMTKREREIIVLIAEGMSNKDIAERLNLSTYTVKSHVHNVMEKLALHSRLQIAAHFHKQDKD